MGRLTASIGVALAVSVLISTAACTGSVGPSASTDAHPLVTPSLGPGFDIGGPGLAERLGPGAQSPVPVPSDAVNTLTIELDQASFDELTARGSSSVSSGTETAHPREQWAVLLCDAGAGLTIEYSGSVALGPVTVQCSGSAKPTIVHLGTIDTDTPGAEVTVTPTGPGTYLLYRLAVPEAAG